MSTKSYTLAGGSTATVTVTSEGVPFNEGMNVLTKAIKAKINTIKYNGSVALYVDYSNWSVPVDTEELANGIRFYDGTGSFYIDVTD